MAVNDPGQLTVTCDECDAEMEMDTTSYCGQPETFGVDDSTLEENGWGSRDGQILCPDCLEKAEEDDA